MSLLYLVADQDVEENRARFVAKVAARMHTNVQILVVENDPEMLVAAENDLAEISQVFEGTDYAIRFVQGNPVTEMETELANGNYDLLILGVGRRKRLIPSTFRMLSQQIIRKSSVPVLLVRYGSLELDRMLVCTGGMEISDRVVDLSARLAGQAGMKATLITVSPPVPSMFTGMEEMDEKIEEILETETPLGQHLRHSAETLADNKITAEVKVVHGDVVEAILEETNTGNYDLVVLGNSEGWTLRGMLLGNVTQQIINRAACAVLVVK
jgi:nucleotide-binding universal stress UspA family protein